MKNLRHRIEAGIVAAINSAKTGTAVASVTIAAAQTVDDKADELVLVSCDPARVPESALYAHLNYEATVTVAIVSNANDTTAATHQDRVEAVRAIMSDESAIKTALDSQDITAYQVRPDGEQDGADGDRMGNALSFVIPLVDNPA